MVGAMSFPQADGAQILAMSRQYFDGSRPHSHPLAAFSGYRQMRASPGLTRFPAFVLSCLHVESSPQGDPTINSGRYPNGRLDVSDRRHRVLENPVKRIPCRNLGWMSHWARCRLTGLPT